MTIPPAAMPVVERLRRDVPDPGKLNRMSRHISLFGWGRKNRCRCPMGLLGPRAACARPFFDDQLSRIGVPKNAGLVFGCWWDDSTTLAEAVEKYRAIWKGEA